MIKRLALYGEQLKDENAKKEHISLLMSYLLCKVASITSIQVVHINAKRVEVQFLMTLLGFIVGPLQLRHSKNCLNTPQALDFAVMLILYDTSFQCDPVATIVLV